MTPLCNITQNSCISLKTHVFIAAVICIRNDVQTVRAVILVSEVRTWPHLLITMGKLGPVFKPRSCLYFVSVSRYHPSFFTPAFISCSSVWSQGGCSPTVHFYCFTAMGYWVHTRGLLSLPSLILRHSIFHFLPIRILLFDNNAINRLWTQVNELPLCHNCQYFKSLNTKKHDFHSIYSTSVLYFFSFLCLSSGFCSILKIVSLLWD